VLDQLPGVRFRHPGILNSPVAMVRGHPRREHLRKSLPQLHIRHAAAQTRMVSAAQFWSIPRKFSPPRGQILILPASAVRILPAQPRSRVSLGHVRRCRISTRRSRAAGRSPFHRKQTGSKMSCPSFADATLHIFLQSRRNVKRQGRAAPRGSTL